MPVLRTSEPEGQGETLPRPWARNAAAVRKAGRIVALTGVILPLLMIGGMKFTSVEIEALRPLIGGTPWLAWMYPVFGEGGASYVLGVVEIATALLLIFLVTCSIMVALPIWEPALGFPALGPAGQFLIKDIALLGIALVVLGESLNRLNKPAT
jgi:uncharacterized membrane protein YkgB